MGTQTPLRARFGLDNQSNVLRGIGTESSISAASAGADALRISGGVLQISNGSTWENVGGSGGSLRVVTLTDAATVTPNADTTDLGILTSLSQTTTFQNPTGTPTNGQLLQIRITSASSQAIAFDTDYQAASGLALPTATTGGGAEDYIALRWNATDDKWDMIGTTIGDTTTITATSLLDTVSSTRGTILYRGASAWLALAAGTAGQVLQTNGAGADPSWITPSNFTIIQKADDESRTSTTTNSADTHLVTESLTADKTYLLELYLVVTGTAAAGGFKAQWIVPSGASIAGSWVNSTATANVVQHTNASVNICTAANQRALQTHRFTGAVIMAGTAGTISLSWSQVTSSGSAVTIKQGSELRYKLGN